MFRLFLPNTNIIEINLNVEKICRIIKIKVVSRDYLKNNIFRSRPNSLHCSIIYHYNNRSMIDMSEDSYIESIASAVIIGAIQDILDGLELNISKNFFQVVLNAFMRSSECKRGYFSYSVIDLKIQYWCFMVVVVILAFARR